MTQFCLRKSGASQVSFISDFIYKQYKQQRYGPYGIHEIQRQCCRMDVCFNFSDKTVCGKELFTNNCSLQLTISGFSLCVYMKQLAEQVYSPILFLHSHFALGYSGGGIQSFSSTCYSQLHLVISHLYYHILSLVLSPFQKHHESTFMVQH